MNNDPPKVIFTTKPSLLVLIDGPPRYRDVGGTDLQLMLNTRATILLDTKKKEYYLNVMDGWLQAPDLVAGPWSYASKIPDDMKEITKGIQERQQAKATGRHHAALAEAGEKRREGSGDLCKCDPRRAAGNRRPATV